MSRLTNYAETAIINYFLRGNPGSAVTSPAGVYLALFTADPGEAGSLASEVSAGEYARQAVTFNAPVNGVANNSAQVAFPDPAGSWGSVTYIGIADAATAGNLLFYASLSVAKTVTVGDPMVLNSGAMQIELTGAWSNWLRDAVINFWLRGNPGSVAAVSPYLAAYTVAPGVTDAGTEVSGTDYARISVAFDAPTDGATSNTDALSFPSAGNAWGTVVALALRTAATDGSLLYPITLSTPKPVTEGDIITLSAGDIDITVA